MSRVPEMWSCQTQHCGGLKHVLPLTTPPWGPREAECTPAHTLPLGNFRLVGKGVVEAGFDGPVQSVKAQRRVLSTVLWATWVGFEG